MSGFSFKSRDLTIDRLLLDPNNYRFLDNVSYKKKIHKKYHLPEVQKATSRLLEQDKRYHLEELKRSILKNGYVPMERIIVVPYKFKKGAYLVIEGNRRVAALKSLLQENKEGVRELSPDQVTQFSTTPCAELIAAEKDMNHAQRVIMGIRHVTGPQDWGAYQQAQLIVELYEQEGQDFRSIADHLGISSVEVGRRYRAMQALKSMQQDELYTEQANYEHYRLFHELVALPEVREYFSWDEKQLKFTDTTKSREFFELIAPLNEEEPKLKAYSDVRKLKLLINYAKAIAVLLDPEKTLTDAIEIAEALQRETKDDASSSLGEILAEINHNLSKIDVLSLKDISSTDVALIEKVISRLRQLIKVGQTKGK